MKLLYFLTLTVLLFITHVYGDITNGTYYIDNTLESTILSQDGNSITNKFQAGNSYITDLNLQEFSSTNKVVTFYFGNDIWVQCHPPFMFSINLFDQDVLNLNSTPTYANIDSQNLTLDLESGEFEVLYKRQNTNSMLTIITPFSSYQLDKGGFYFKVFKKSAIAFVGAGVLTAINTDAQGNNYLNYIVHKDNMSVAVPYTNPLNGDDTKMTSIYQPLKTNEIAIFNRSVSMLNNYTNNVRFVVIDNKLVGILNN